MSDDELVFELRKRGVELEVYNYKWLQTRGRFQTLLEGPMAYAETVIEKLGPPDAERPPKVLVIPL